jgi:hypothetical protein
LLEIIWGMSGPQMLGIAHGCLFQVKGFKLNQCRLGSNPTVTHMNLLPGGWFFGLSASLLGSTGKDAKNDDGTVRQPYDAGEIWMLAGEPGIAYRSIDKPDKVQLHHGFGISWNWFFGRDIRGFDKFAFTVTPIEVATNRFALGLKLRLYPNGFTDEEFKPGPKRSGQNRPFELTVGFTGALILKKDP